jgi:hypothetical protein
MQFFDNYSVYICDVELLEKLKLKPYFDIPVHTEHYIGEAELPNGSKVKLWVQGEPAQFFKAEVYCAETKKSFTIETGSGSLSDYWPFIEEMANGMIVVTSQK